MIVDRSGFFARAKAIFTGAHLAQRQVDGMTAILDAWDCWAPANADIAPNLRWLAYALATTFHETGQTMQPVRETGRGHGHDYGVADLVTGQVYYGRGLVQLTWKANYQVQGQRLGLDLEHDPDRALEPRIAADILLHGMAAGSFTGRRLGQYFEANLSRDDPVGARRIINGTDQATLIASYHRVFLAAVQPAGLPEPTQPHVSPRGATT